MNVRRKVIFCMSLMMLSVDMTFAHSPFDCFGKILIFWKFIKNDFNLLNQLLMHRDSAVEEEEILLLHDLGHKLNLNET
jgi:hypothetical protein